MKKLFAALSMAAVLVLAGSTSAQTLTFTMMDGQVIAGPKFQFEVWIASSNGTSRMGDILVYLNYNTAGFGSSVAANGKISVTKGGDFGTTYSMNATNDNTGSRVAWSWTYSGTAGSGVVIPGTGVGTLAFIVQIDISNPTETSSLSFEGGLMDGEQYLDDRSTKWSGVVATSTINQALPIQLSSFASSLRPAGQVSLEWSTTSETNNYGFEVQRSEDRLAGFVTISGSFQPGHGTTLQPQHYSYLDVTATASEPWYRLKQTDLDGSIHYSESHSVTGLTAVDETAPKSFQLLQNYPNPFNPETQIKFSVEKSGRAMLRVYNTIGQEVATLFDGVAEAGRYYRVKLDGRNMASGVYLYRLVSGEKSDVKRLLMVK